jgi:hypothetical protein
MKLFYAHSMNLDEILQNKSKVGIMPSSGMLHCVALVRIDVSEAQIMSIIWVTTIGRLGTMLAVTSN